MVGLTKVHHTREQDLVVFQDVDHVREGDALVGAAAALFGVQTSFDERTFILIEPAGLFGEVGQEEPKGRTDDNGEKTFKNEDPAPTGIAARAVGDLANRGSEQAAKGASEGSTAEEEGEAPLRFGTLVPHTDEIEACGNKSQGCGIIDRPKSSYTQERSWSRRHRGRSGPRAGRPRIGRNPGTWRRCQMRPWSWTLRIWSEQCRRRRGETRRTPDMRSQLLHQEIGRDLQDGVWDEEDGLNGSVKTRSQSAERGQFSPLRCCTCCRPPCVAPGACPKWTHCRC